MNLDRFKFRAWLSSIEELVYSDSSDSLHEFFEEVYPMTHRDILMQCTGLEDIEGKLIYEGDLVQPVNERGFDFGTNKDKNFDVFWFAENGAWYIRRNLEEEEIKQFSPYKAIIELLSNCDVKITGNVYETNVIK